MAKIFLSYNRDIHSIASELVSDLEKLNHHVWFDKDLHGGQSWWEEILLRIRACDIFALVLTPDTLESAACKLEYKYAHELGKSILPILASDEVSPNLLPPELSAIQYVDYRKQDRNAAIDLANAVVSIPTAKPLPDPLPPSPGAPISYLGSLSAKLRKSTLSREEQSTLFLELKRNLRDPENSVDAMALLKVLRRHQDLRSSIAEEIDTLIKSNNLFKTNPQEKKVIGIKNKRPSHEPFFHFLLGERQTGQQRTRAALILAFIAILMVCILATTYSIRLPEAIEPGRYFKELLIRQRGLFTVFGLYALSGAITGFICGMRKGGFIAALVVMCILTIYAWINWHPMFYWGAKVFWVFLIPVAGVIGVYVSGRKEK